MSLSSNFNQFAGKLLVSNISYEQEFFNPFYRSAIFVLESTDDGVAGVDLTRKLSGPQVKGDNVYLGGPVQHVTLLNKTDDPNLAGGAAVENAPYASYVATFTGAAFPDSYKDAENVKNGKVLVGLAGWAPGQLEAEIEAGFWNVIDADTDLVFDTPSEQLYDACASRAGMPRTSDLRFN